MDDVFLQVCLFCLSEDREYLSIQTGHLNVFGIISVAGVSQLVNLVRIFFTDYQLSYCKLSIISIIFLNSQMV